MFGRNAKAKNTRRAYGSAWGAFLEWCNEHGRVPLPAAPETVMLYVTELAGRGGDSTISVAMAAISYAHQLRGLESPVKSVSVKTVLAGIRRTKRSRKVRKHPADRGVVSAMLAGLDRSTVIGKRDAAVILVGYVGAFRRSELVAVHVEDLDWLPDGVNITVAVSKGDQEGKGEVKGIPFGADPELCPVRALHAWLIASRAPVAGRRVFPIDASTVARIVKRAALVAGLDPAVYSGHSLRAGFVTEALRQGVDGVVVAKQTGHKSVNTLLGYYRDEGVGRGGAKRVI